MPFKYNFFYFTLTLSHVQPEHELGKPQTRSEPWVRPVGVWLTLQLAGAVPPIVLSLALIVILSRAVNCKLGLDSHLSHCEPGRMRVPQTR